MPGRILLIPIFSCLYCTGQCTEQRWVIGVGLSAGASNYAGELDDNFTLFLPRPDSERTSTPVFSRLVCKTYSFSRTYHIASDSKGRGVNFSGNQYRNLSFLFWHWWRRHSYPLYTLQSRRKGFSKRNRIAPYLFTGFAYFQFNPKKNLNGENNWVAKSRYRRAIPQRPYLKPYSPQRVFNSVLD